jgi:hypothetical protein
MAIRRCPYCKAIIDEQDKYCNNCGTQLLFPEDEFIEEEIPGDKIIDKEEAEEEETAEEELDEEQELEAELEEEEEFIEDEEEEEEEGRIKAEGEAEDEGKPEELHFGVEDVEEQGVDELKARPGDEESGAESGTPEKDAGLEEAEGVREAVDKERDEEEVEEEEEEFGSLDAAGTGEPVEPAAVAMDAATPGIEFPPADESAAVETSEEKPAPAKRKDQDAEADKKYELSIEEDELVLKTKDMTRRMALTDETKKGRERLPDTASLPPWANRIRETPATVEPEEETRTEPRPLSREWTTDSGIGIPEKITQAALPFGDAGERSVQTPGREEDHVEDTTDIATPEVEAGRPVPLALKLRAKLVDWVFVTALWVISLWFTAQVVGVSFFRLLFGSPLPVLAFYAILLILYFFLFLYFLGETLGDHYFSE